MLRRKELLTHDRIKLLLSWEHSDFNVNASVRIGAGCRVQGVRIRRAT